MLGLFIQSVFAIILVDDARRCARPGSPSAGQGAPFHAGQAPLFFSIKPRYRRMIGPIFEFADLQRLSGFDRRADVERWANDNGIPVKACRGGVWTTLAAVNLSLGISLSNDNVGSYPPDAV